MIKIPPVMLGAPASPANAELWPKAVLLRYDSVHPDYSNGLTARGFTGSPLNGAASATRNRFTPGGSF
jgi:hypothetical protein